MRFDLPVGSKLASVQQDLFTSRLVGVTFSFMFSFPFTYKQHALCFRNCCIREPNWLHDLQNAKSRRVRVESQLLVPCVRPLSEWKLPCRFRASAACHVLSYRQDHQSRRCLQKADLISPTPHCVRLVMHVQDPGTFSINTQSQIVQLSKIIFRCVTRQSNFPDIECTTISASAN